MIMRKGQPLVLVICVLVLTLTLVTSARAYIEQFDTSPADWLVNTINNTGTTTGFPATWSTTGGNPGGMISGLADDSGERLLLIFKWTNTAGFWGDLTGMALTTDFKITGSVTGARDALAWFFIQADSSWFYSKMTWDPNADTDWTTHMVPLTENNFFGIGNFADTLKNYKLIGIQFGTQIPQNYQEYGLNSAAGATLSIDNFGVVAAPLPASVLLLGSSLLGLMGWRRFGKS